MIACCLYSSPLTESALNVKTFFAIVAEQPKSKKTWTDGIILAITDK